MAEPYMTPDMQAAGVQQPEEPMSQAGLVDALRSRGTLPSGLAQSMIPTGGANAGLAFGSGVLNALSGGNAAANPYLTQQQEQQNRQFWQIRQAMADTQRQQEQLRQAQEREVARQARQNELALRMTEGALAKATDGPLKERLTKDYAGLFAKVTGSAAGADVATALARKDVTMEQVNGVMLDAGRKMTPELIATKYNLPLPKVLEIMQMDPGTIEQIGADDQRARALKTAELEIKQSEAIQKRIPPELQGDPKFYGAVLRMHLKQNPGIEYKDGSSESQARAADSALKALQDREDAVSRAKEQAALDRALLMLGARNAQKSTSWTGPQMTKELGKLTKYDKLMESINELRQIVPELEKLGVTASGDSWPAQQLAAFNANVRHPANSAVRRFKVLWPAFEIGQVARGYFDELNARQKAAFEEQLKMGTTLPTRKTFDEYLNLMEGLVVRQMRDTIRGYETIGAPADLQEEARNIYAPYAHIKSDRKIPKVPSGETTAPQGPLTPKANKRYNLNTGEFEVIK